jgi:hypothetical protein
MLYTNNAHPVPVTNLGAETWTGSGGDAYVFEGGTKMTLSTNTQGTGYPGSNSQFRLNIAHVSGDTLTEPTITGSGTDTATLSDWAGNLTTVTVYRLTVYARNSAGATVSLEEDITLTPADQGSDGADGNDGTDGTDGFALNHTNNSHAVPVTNLGVETWTGSGGDIYVFEGGTLLTLSTNTQGTGYPGSNSQFRLNITKVSGDTLTEPGITGSGTTKATIADWAGNLTTATVYLIRAYVRNSSGGTLTLDSYTTLSPSDQGTDGNDGADGFTHYLTNQAFVVAAASDGTGYSLTGSGGTHKLYEGTTDRTTSATHSVSGTATKNGLTMSVVSGTGVYSLSGASWTSDSESFTLRAAYGGVNYDADYVITKAKAGTDGGGSSVTAIGKNVVDIASSPTNAWAEYKSDGDGDAYEKEGTGASYVSIGTWLQSGAAGDYDVQFEIVSGSLTAGSSSSDTWLDAASDRAWYVEDTSTGGGPVSCTGIIKYRDGTTFELLSQADVQLTATKSL